MARKRRTDNKGRVLRVGESQDKSGRYCFKYTDINKKRHAVYALTLTELREKEVQIERDRQDGINITKGNLSLNQLFKFYIDTKTDLRDTTRCNYIASWNTGVKNTFIGEMKITAIKQMHIKRLYADYVEKGLSYNTVKLYHNLIYPSLQLAVDSDIIRKNPAKGCRQGIEKKQKEKCSLTMAQQEAFLHFIKNHNSYSVYYPMLFFALSTALRIGELSGLRWSDVDLKENIIHIRQQLIYKNLGDGCKFHIQSLKTDAGRRDIPLTEDVRKSLIKQKEICLMLGKEAKRQAIEGITDFVFTNSQGKPYAVNAMNFILNNIVKAYNYQEKDLAEKEHREAELLPHISAHILRHTGCTRLAESGIEPKTLQYIMGHSNISVTMDIYNHVDTIRIKNEMEKAEGTIKYG